jgi:hypothetical protein
MAHDLKALFNCFKTAGTFLKGEPFGSGHIHETFHISTAGSDQDDYILQKLNNKVFRNIPELQENIERVTGHLQKKISAIPDSDIRRECLILVHATDGKSWITDNYGNFWRMFIFIRDHRSYDIVDSPGKALEGGKAIGRFQALLADLPGEPLHDTIPFFHDVEKRIDNFISTLGKDPANRAGKTKTEIDAMLKRSDKMRIVHKLGREGKIPVRITHNDTKFNNILFDENDKSLCIIDLDTVMSGYFHSDFGDAIRTGANRGAEDDVNLSNVGMDITLFEAYANGYLSETRNTLNAVEKEYLAFAPILMTYEQTLRFLTDYLDGDTYYKIHHEHHNLQRTRAQLNLLESMEQQYAGMQKIIKELA